MQHVYGHYCNTCNESGLWALPQATTLPLVGFTMTLMQLRVLAVTTSLQ